jgi:hypothetical protein
METLTQNFFKLGINRGDFTQRRNKIVNNGVNYFGTNIGG